MNKELKKNLTFMSISVLALAAVFALKGVSQPDLSVRGAGGAGGAPTLKMTWDFSTNKTTNTTAFSTTTLKTFIESYDSPSVSYTVSETNNTFRGSGNTTDSWPDDNWKFSSSSKAGSATIEGLPTYGFVKIWAYQWDKDVASLSVNDGTAVSITGNEYKLYEFDVADSTTFKITAVKRSMIQKIEFWGC